MRGLGAGPPRAPLGGLLTAAGGSALAVDAPTFAVPAACPVPTHTPLPSDIPDVTDVSESLETSVWQEFKEGMSHRKRVAVGHASACGRAPERNGRSAVGGDDVSDVLELVDRLGRAFLTRDVEAALACFVPDDDITYVGSEAGESATGRAAVRQLLAAVFARPMAYTWQATSATVHSLPGAAFVIADADGAEHAPDGAVEPFPYRITGLLSRRSSGAWLWRAVQGSEPTQP